MEIISQSKKEITLWQGRKEKTYPIISDPLPHILVDSKKELHGWYEGIKPYGRRECTSERLLINPYNGCSHNCLFCYAHSYWGYLELFQRTGIITVFRRFDQVIARQLESISIAACGYLSPVTDPFQEVNKRYQLSEKIICEFLSRNLPLEFITKGVIPQAVIEKMKGHPHSFGQVSILTLNEDLRLQLMRGGATTSLLLDNIKRLSKANIFAVVRIDPIIPYLTDNLKDLEKLLREVKQAGAKHIIVSCLDIPIKTSKDVYQALGKIDKGILKRYKSLYTERIGYLLNANIYYRQRLFQSIKELSEKYQLTFALCMEYALTQRRYKGRRVVEGLNKYFMTSLNCEGIDVPFYKRKGEKFEPVNNCLGNCLTCSEPLCQVPELTTGGSWKLKDYKRWSKENQLTFFK